MDSTKIASPLDLDAIASRADAATAGPWKVWGMTVVADRQGTGDVDDCDDICATVDPERGLKTFNADFISQAREDIPALLLALAAERDRADRAEAKIADAWDEGAEATFYDPESRDLVTWGDNPYRPEATA